MTSKQHTARQSGPITLDARTVAGQVRVTVDRRSHAQVTISTADATGASADAVNSATLDEGDGRIVAHVREGGGSGGVTIQSGGGQTNIFRSGGGVTITQVGGSVYGNVSGVVVTGNGVFIGGSGVVIGGSPIVIEAFLPAGSSLVAETTSGDVQAVGDLRRAQTSTVSGDVNLEGVADLDARSTSGDVTVEAFAGGGSARTVSGDIRVHARAESDLRARTVSGDVRVAGARVKLDASTVSGRVTQR